MGRVKNHFWEDIMSNQENDDYLDFRYEQAMEYQAGGKYTRQELEAKFTAAELIKFHEDEIPAEDIEDE